MDTQTVLYWLTFVSLYLELGGGFLLAVEAIGPDHLQKTGNFLRKRRILCFSLFLIATGLVLVFAKIFNVFAMTEVAIIIISIGLFVDFAPRLFEIILRRVEKGTAGLIGFLLFAAGFSIQAYVNLVQLR